MSVEALAESRRMVEGRDGARQDAAWREIRAHADVADRNHRAG